MYNSLKLKSWLVRSPQPCSFSKATLTTTPIRRISLSLRSTPDTSEWSPGSGTSASLYAWSCWAAMTRGNHRLTSNSASSPQTAAEEQRIVCSVHRLCLCVTRDTRLECSAWSTFWLGTFSVSVKINIAKKILWRFCDLNLNGFGFTSNLVA